ncbi:type VII secretion target [Actinoplanes aureus]|uniref:Uncharacterized protein n=1 Tax=Actinoplanes aureus TaxID=2792083 RepID=A0A931FYI6_9ACTN|nr:type VII secretion target [Actinoplanes aureus]MBG0564628.1 hypothetical protein [Actinoplanes aureus]
MALPHELAVDVPALEQAGAGVEAAAVTLSDARSSSDGNLAPGRHAGWDTATTAAEAAGVWNGYLDGLAAEVRGFGRELLAAARRIQATDQSSGQDIDRVPR